MFIDTTMTPKVDDLLKGMIVQSGNDASVVLAEAVGGSLDDFVAMMNRQAQAWGLKNTQFSNVTGLSEPGHYASARDVAIIAAKIITDFPDFYRYYSIRQFTYNKIKQDNRNLLLGRDPTVDGMKTGYTEAAGYCLVASAVREMPNGKRRLVSVVLGTASREARAGESQKLLNWGFQALDAVRLFEAGKPIATVPVWKGKVRRGQARRAGRVVRQRAQGRGRQAEDADRAHRPAGRAAGPGPAGRADQGQHGRRHAGGRACRWWCWSRWSWPASSAAPGTRCACGSSKLQALAPRNTCHVQPAARHAVLPERRVHPRVRRQGVGARPRLHLRRRHLRGGAGVRPAPVPLRRAHGAAAARPGQGAHRQPARPRRLAGALPPPGAGAGRADRRAGPAGLHPDHARRGAARPCHAGGHRRRRCS